jgi:hypothetical protein
MTTQDEETWSEEWEDELAQPWNECIAVRGQATLGQAFALLKSAEVNCAAWRHLVVAKTDGTWAVGKIEDLNAQAKAAGETKLDTPLDELDWLLTVKAYDQATIGIDEAKDEARNNTAKVLVVTDGDELAGILYVGLQRSKTVSTSTLTGLPGESIDLKEVRRFLIPKRRRRTPTGKKRKSKSTSGKE